MYLDRLDGRITAAFFDEKAKGWRDEQKQIDARTARLATTGLRSATEALRVMSTKPVPASATPSLNRSVPKRVLFCQVPHGKPESSRVPGNRRLTFLHYRTL
jgi:hypothetical protein